MSYFAYDRMGGSIRTPSTEQMVELLDSLAVVDNEHPDVSMNNHDGWGISVFGSGLVIFENVESGEGPWYQRDLSREKVFSLWQQLAADDIEGIRAGDWKDGYGQS